MKTKLFLAAVAVAFSFAVTSCGNQKAANTEVEATDAVEVVEEAQACDSVKACCKDEAAACDSTKACCKDKEGCEKKACDKK